MLGSPSIRGSRTFGAAFVLLVHVVFVLFLIGTPFGESLVTRKPEPPPIDIVELGALHKADAPPADNQAPQMQVPRIIFPEIQDISIEEPAPAPTTVVASVAPPAAPTQQSEDAGANGQPDGKSRQLLTRVAPEYPREAKRAGQEGTTQALMRVDESGRVVEVKIISGSGSRRLDDAAVRAFKQWKFVSVPAGTAPEGSWVQTSHRFQLTNIKYTLLKDGAAEDIQ